MRKLSMGPMGRTFALALAVALPALCGLATAQAKATAKSGTSTAKNDEDSSSDKGLSKEDQAKLKEHNKLRAEITKMKYPASKDVIVSHVKGIKPDDKKWFEETLPDKTFGSADEVMAALGWETGTDEKSASTKAEKANKAMSGGKSK